MAKQRQVAEEIIRSKMKRIVEITEQTDGNLDTILYFEDGIKLTTEDDPSSLLYQVRVNTTKIKVPSPSERSGESAIMYETMAFVKSREGGEERIIPSLACTRSYGDWRNNRWTCTV